MKKILLIMFLLCNSLIAQNMQDLFLEGMNYMYKNNYEKAAEIWTKIIKLKPDSLSNYYSMRASCYTRLGKYSNALDDYDKAISADPSDEHNYSMRGTVNYKLGKFEDAEKDFNKYFDLGGWNYDFCLYRALTRFLLNNIEGAIQDCEKYLILHEESSQAFCLLMDCYYLKKDFENASIYYNKLQKKLDPKWNPNNPEKLSDDYKSIMGIVSCTAACLDTNILENFNFLLRKNFFVLSSIDNDSWFYYSNISFTVTRTNGKSKIKSENFPALHYTAFQGPQNVNKSNDLFTLNPQTYSYMFSMYWASEGLGISFGYEKRSPQKQEVQFPGGGNVLWKGIASIEDSWYWFKMWYEFITLDLGFGMLGSNLMVQMGGSPESKLKIRSERWDGNKLGTYVDQTYTFKTNLSYLVGAELQYYLPYLPITLGIGYTLGVKGPVKTDKYELTTSTPSGSIVEEGSGSVTEYGVGYFSGTYLFVNVCIPFK